MFDDFDDDRHDEELARELLGILSEDLSEPPDGLTDRTIRKVEAELTSRDLLDLTTLVFLTSFCAPILDLFASFFGHETARGPRVRGSMASTSDASVDASDTAGLTNNSLSSSNASSAPGANDLLSSDETNRDSHDE